MINLERFFDVQFNDVNISRQSLRKFTQDHLQRLAAQNSNGRYDRMIQDTQRCYDNYFSSLNSLDSSASERQGSTMGMNNALAQFKNKISRTEGLIRHAYNTATPQYKEFFPQGMSEYHAASLENVETLMSRFIKALKKYESRLGTEEQTEFTNLLNAFVNARETQLWQKGLVSASSSSADIERNEMEIQLSKNLFRLAYRYMGKPNAAAIFFDQSIIRSTAGTDTNAGDDVIDMNAGESVAAAV